MKYELKLQTVTATQWNSPDDHPKVHLLPGKTIGWLSSHKGGYAVCPGDWILEDEAGEFKVLPDHKFKALYKEVT